MPEEEKRKRKSEDFFEDIESTSPTLPKSPPPKTSGPSVKVIHACSKEKQKQIDPQGCFINCTSLGNTYQIGHDLSPMFLGPCKLYGGHVSQTVENAWQYSKVYPKHVGSDGNPTPEYFEWAHDGWAQSRGCRHPMGKDAKASYYWWDNRKLSRVEARKEIYVPLYVQQVTKVSNRTFDALKTRWLMMKVNKKGTLYLMDVDDYDTTGMTLSQVLNNPSKSLGHGYVLAMLLTEDAALKECKLRPTR